MLSRMSNVDFLILVFAAWWGAVLSPLIIAGGFWFGVRKKWGAWPAHLLCGPSMVAAELSTVRLLFFAAHDNGDGPPGLGIALLPAFALFLGSLAVYYVCAGYEILGSVRRRAGA